MNKKGLKFFGGLLAVLIVLAIVIGGWLILSRGNSSSTANAVAGSSNETKLSDSPYANYAYLISSDTLSPEAQQAITGFQINKAANSDGTTTYNLIASNPEYQNQSYTLQPGQSLYFIERSLGDDNDGTEGFLGDDHAIIVDSNGYIVQGPLNFQ
ncbi:MAG TPA: hypothetical protein VMC80_03845 [Patescibacteria group bacterium]|nr:hypothetical protein [Patescibacteria group bacterium]